MIREGVLIWITGLSGSGKTTIGKKVYEQLKAQHGNVVFLDGDTFRDILGNDLGHEPSARLANALRISRMCKFLTAQNIHVVCATMSLFAEVHDFNRREIPNYYEVFVEVPMEELIRRDQKQLYSRVLAGETHNVVGIDLPYDKPKACDLILENSGDIPIKTHIKVVLNLIYLYNSFD